LNGQLELFSFLICAILLFDICQRREKTLFDDKLFLAMLIANMLILILDVLGWSVDGRSIPLVNAIYMRTFLMYFIINPVLPYLWLLYTDYQIYMDTERLRRLLWPYLIPLILSTLMVIANPFNHALFYIDQSNVYHRGPWFNVFLVLAFSYMLYAFILILAKRQIIGKRHFLPLVLSPLPPLIGAFIQTCYYGIALIWSGLTLSLLIIYIYMQNRKLDTDYLTGLYNRKQLDRYLEHKIHDLEAGHKFSAIMIDIDGFKKINDQYGHVSGDEALEITAELLKKSLRKNDFLARYGGDEFMVIIDIADIYTLGNTVVRINENFSNFNLTEAKPFKLNVSIGYGIYDNDSPMSAVQFIEHVDALMYANKKQKLIHLPNLNHGNMAR
jgi:diguanylate cyclase (GGDEF)-like protein